MPSGRNELPDEPGRSTLAAPGQSRHDRSMRPTDLPITKRQRHGTASGRGQASHPRDGRRRARRARQGGTPPRHAERGLGRIAPGDPGRPRAPQAHRRAPGRAHRGGQHRVRRPHRRVDRPPLRALDREATVDQIRLAQAQLLGWVNGSSKLMQADTDKHIRILRFIRDHARHDAMETPADQSREQGGSARSPSVPGTRHDPVRCLDGAEPPAPVRLRRGRCPPNSWEAPCGPNPPAGGSRARPTLRCGRAAKPARPAH
jgi:hypothetical protein